MGYDPYGGFEKYQIKRSRKPLIRDDLKNLLFGIIIFNIVFTALLCYGLISRPQAVDLEEFEEGIDSMYYEHYDLVYVEVYVYEIEEGENFFAILEREEEIGIFGIIIDPAPRIYLHNYFKNKIETGKTYICEAKIYKYTTDYHEPGEYSITYDVRDVYLKSDFGHELDKYTAILIAAILIIIVSSWYFASEFYEKEITTSSKKVTGNILLLFSIIFVAWAFFRYLFHKPLETFEGYSFVIETVAGYLLIFGPILLYTVFIEKKDLNPRNIKHNLALSISLGLLFCFISLFILFFLERSFVQFFFKNEVGDFEFNYNNFTIPQLILNFVFFFGVIAVVEETVFRWFFAGRFEKLLNFDVAVLLSSILFGIMHIPVGLFGYHLNPSELGGYIFSNILFGIMLGYFYLKTHNLVGVILWHGLWDFMVFNFTFPYSPIHYITWQSQLVINIVVDIVIFFVIMALMTTISKHFGSTQVLSPYSPKEQIIEASEIVEVEEIPHSRYDAHFP